MYKSETYRLMVYFRIAKHGSSVFIRIMKIMKKPLQKFALKSQFNFLDY